MQAETFALRGYLPAIAEATGAPEPALPILEEIMRTEIFHSTLDWQSAEEFRNGARKAYELYLEDQEFYDANARWRKALFRVSVAEQAIENLREGRGDDFATAEAELEAARFDEAAARASLSEVSPY